MNETLEQDYQNRFNDLTKKLQTLREQTSNLTKLIYSCHDDFEDFLYDLENTLDEADKFTEEIDSAKNLVGELNLIADMLEEKRNEQ